MRVKLSDARVCHVTRRANISAIMTEGLLPLAKNRPKELQVVDFAFDITAERLGIKHRRAGMFAWPSLELARTAGDAIFQVNLDPNFLLVLHQSWLDLAWGITGTILSRFPLNLQNSAGDLFDSISNLFIYEGKVEQVLFELAELYWTTGIHLASYDDNSIYALNSTVIKHKQLRFHGLLPHLDHEVAIGTKAIPVENLTLID